MDKYYMEEAIKEAKKAFKKGEVPVGAVIVKDNKIIARAHNLRETKNNSIKHAEIIAISKACRKLGWRLEDCTIYVTIEPCPMCSGAIMQARIDRLCYGAKEVKNGCAGSIINLFNYPFSHHTLVSGGIMEKECGEIMSNFFKNLRMK